MTSTAFINDLRARGVTLELEGETLRVTPSNLLTDTDRAAWRQHKQEIIQEIISLLETASRETAATSSTRIEPLAPARAAEIVDTSEALAFVRAVRLVKVPEFLRLSEAETREYKNVVACLDCAIDPRDGFP